MPENKIPVRRVPRWVEQVALLLDGMFHVGRFRFGLDALAGLLPVGGDLAAALVGCSIIVSAAWNGVPKVTLLRMIVYLAADMWVGSVPVIGDGLDFLIRANQWNVDLYRQAMAGTRDLRRDWLFLAVVILLLIALLAAPFVLFYLLWDAIATMTR